MAITVRETKRRIQRARSEEGGTSEAHLEYWAYGSSNMAAIELAVLGYAPATFDGLLLDDYEIDLQELGGDNWTANLNYSSKKIDEGDYRWSFSTGGATVKQNFGFTWADYGENVVPTNGAINLNQDNLPEGVDVGISQLNLVCTARIPGLFINFAYLNYLKALTYKVNNAPFLGFAAGELLLTGVEGDIDVFGKSTDLSFNFAASENVSNLQIGDITGINKGGHQFLWMRFKDDDSGERLTVAPEQVTVNTVYQAASYAPLMIGVSA